MIKHVIQILILFLSFSLVGCYNKSIVKSYTVYSPDYEILDTLTVKSIKESMGMKYDELLTIPGNKSIIIVNDSILNYFVDLGGIGSITSIRYALIDSVMFVDSIDIYNREEFSEEDIFNHKFLYSKDSLVDLCTNEKYLINNFKKKNQPRTIMSY